MLTRIYDSRRISKMNNSAIYPTIARIRTSMVVRNDSYCKMLN